MVRQTVLSITHETDSPPSGVAVVQAEPKTIFGRLWRTLFRRSTLGLIDQALVSGTRFLLTIMIGRFCGQGELGIYTLGFSLIVSLVSIKYSLISLPYTVYAGRTPERTSYAGSTLVHLGLLLLTTALGLTIASLTISTGWGPFTQLQEFGPMLGVLAIVMPLILTWEYTRRYMFANLRLSAVLTIDAVLAVVLIAGASAVYLSGQLSALTALGVMGASCAIATLPWLYFARSEFRFSREKLLSDWKRNWSFGQWIFAGQLSWSGMSNAVPWILAFMYGKEETGAYGACMTLSLLSNPVIIGFGNTLLPTMANAFNRGGAQEVRRIAGMASLGVGAVMGCFCIAVGFFGGDFLVTVLNKGYTGLDLPILVLALATTAQTLSIGPDIGTQVLERPDLNFRANWIGFLVVLCVSYPLAANWGVLGGAIAWLISNIAASITRWVCFYKIVNQPIERTEAIAS